MRYGIVSVLTSTFAFCIAAAAATAHAAGPSGTPGVWEPLTVAQLNGGNATAMGDYIQSIMADPVNPGTFYLAAGNNDGRNITWLGETVNLAAKLEKHNKTEAASACARASLIQLALAQDPQLVPGEFELRRSRQVAGVAETIDLSVWPS